MNFRYRHPLLCRAAVAPLLLAGLGLGAAGCERNDMHNQPRYEPNEASTFFDDGQSSRQTVPGTIARGQLVASNMRFGGPATEPPADAFPFEITKADLKRGKERYDIYCGVCHGATGDGNGMVVRRGFVAPPSFHDARVKDKPVGHYFDVMTNGFGAMYSYNDRITPEDRWRIAAYVRVLQLSQEKSVAAVTARPASAVEAASPADAPADAVQQGAPENATTTTAGETSQPQQPQPQQQQEQPPQAQPSGAQQ